MNDPLRDPSRPARRERLDIPPPRQASGMRGNGGSHRSGSHRSGSRGASRSVNRWDGRESWRDGSGQSGRYSAGNDNPALQRWKIALAAIFLLVTALVLLSVFTSNSHSADPSNNAANNTAESSDSNGGEDRGDGPIPDGQGGENLGTGELPPGGAFAERGSGNYTTVGSPGAKAGEGAKSKYTYVVEIEDTIDPAGMGGADAFAAMVDATLTNPKSWTADKAISFQHVKESDLPAGTEPDLRIQLSSTETTHDVCGFTYRLETSCFMPIGNRVVLNDSRWVRGAQPFNGDLGGYRQYVINHEVGHGIGYAAHQACHENGALAPVMMQQTLSVINRELHEINPNENYGREDATCLPNPWPYPNGRTNQGSETENGTREES